MTTLDVTMRRPADLGPDDLALWRSFLAADPALASPFLRPEAVVALGRNRADVTVAVVEQRGRVVAFLPLERRRAGLTRLAGHGVFDHQALVHAPGFDHTGAQLLAACGIARCEFEHLVQPQVQAFAPRRVALHPSPVIDLSDGYEAWLAGRRAASGGLKRAAQKRRKLLADVPDVRFEADCRDPGALRTLMAWKSEQYRRTSRRDRFAQPWFAELVRELCGTRTDGFAGVLSVLWAGERPLAVSLGLRAGATYASWFPTYDPAAAQRSPGLVALLHLVEALAADGVRVVDLGEGEADYKKYFANAHLLVAEGVVQRPSLVAAAQEAVGAPRRAVEGAVLSSPRLRRAARLALSRAGQVRERARGGRPVRGPAGPAGPATGQP